MSSEPHRDLPSSAFDGVTPPSRELTLWRDEPPTGQRAFMAPPLKRFLPYALGAALLLGGGFSMANFATAPSLTDGVEEVTAIDARRMGLASNLDPAGSEKRSAALSRDVGALKNEIVRLQKALVQAKTGQAALTKTAAGQAATNQDEVRALKTEIAALTKTLGETRDVSTAKIDALQAKVEQGKQDEAHLAELRERLDKIEKANAELAAKRDDGPATTGSVAKPEPAATPATPVVKGWTLREVYDDVAVLEGRRGTIEVERGASAPGVGRVKSIERRAGEWVVVTDRGLILQR
jgi:predicted  nucleic acid-binding Zn-ribbon protein